MTTYPSIDELKAQARRLRQAMAERGDDMSHSTALELIAKQHGLRDWNTLSALAAKPKRSSRRDKTLQRSQISRS